jgi:hypothetical protein
VDETAPFETAKERIQIASGIQIALASEVKST